MTTDAIMPVTRRSVLAFAGVAAGCAATGLVTGPAQAAAPELPPTAVPGRLPARSANGFPIVSADDVQSFRIEGSDATVRLLPGAVATVLLHVARRFHYEIEPLRTGDVVGHRTAADAPEGYLSNALSGTAIAVKPQSYPLGATHGFFAPQLSTLRDILAECGGVVRWGGDGPGTVQEGFFTIDVPPDSDGLRTLAEKINGWNTMPGYGAGTPIDPTEPKRLAASAALARQQQP